ncbi:N-alpha-acetyltransferase 35, NatC auxiliary subunit [Lingula anatina]|uniref:Protein MAK10 homolog n=1 Tax=Lingula anatina TaxID=7574 RepID=A0A1S3HWP2_LINAN|nr:N-alpha-acetyltransferase 35, NatC auxiliary subunit [Lingula anatina]XP_013389971.1 N-alpha-acetyltransferase 35, NatC auxiliary subunit [Lingula anatina]|eukprot:XP_013389970.1 N-alpha-acetyltransferase 35, NatC auxiliary subunit [Lingula anatina]
MANAEASNADKVQPQGSTETVLYNWQDVTEEFMEAASELSLGELLHDSDFGLFEAMSAIEMMDPKMDAGMMCNQTKRKVLSFEQAIEAGTIKIQDIPLQDQIGIMDMTLSCLVTWLEGHSLAQTVFTNLYLHNPFIIEDRFMKAFSLCMLKIVDLIRDRINRASVFEEEDFQPMTYGFKMAGDITDMRVTGMVKEAEEELSKTIRNTRSKSGEERTAVIAEEHELAVAVFSRLKFCRLLLTTLLAFTKEKCQGIPDADKYCNQMLELIPALKSTIQLGVQPDEKSADYPLIMGFEPLVNQRLLPPTFPRYTRIKTRGETIQYLQELIHDFKAVCSVTECTTLHGAIDFFLEFSRKSPSVLSRSLVQLAYLNQSRRVFGTQLMQDVLREQIRNFIAPPALMLKSPILNNPQAKEHIDALLTHAVRPLCNVIQITGHNRARQRDKWGHLLEELATLQEEADRVDSALHGALIKVDPNRQHLACFGTWVLYHTLHVMIYYIQSGFELELYAPHEYHYIFWYLYEVLYNWLVSSLNRADTFLMEQDAIAEQQKGRNAKKNKKKKKGRQYAREVAIIQGTQALCGGFYKALVGFNIDGKLKQPEVEFDSEEVRYNHRFAPFGVVGTPPPVHYTQFKDMTDLRRFDHDPSAQEMYTAACKNFQQARICYESVSNPTEEINNLIKVSKTNMVVMNLLAGGHKKESKNPPGWDFSVHRNFPIIKVM